MKPWVLKKGRRLEIKKGKHGKLGAWFVPLGTMQLSAILVLKLHVNHVSLEKSKQCISFWFSYPKVLPSWSFIHFFCTSSQQREALKCHLASSHTAQTECTQSFCCNTWKSICKWVKPREACQRNHFLQYHELSANHVNMSKLGLKSPRCCHKCKTENYPHYKRETRELFFSRSQGSVFCNDPWISSPFFCCNINQGMWVSVLCFFAQK